MREQQSFSDGSVDLGQGAISPSTQDIAFFKNQNRPPLRTFPGRQALAPVAIVGTSVLVLGCVNTSPDNGPQQNSGELSISDRFDTFFDEYNEKQTEISPVLGWIDMLGIPRDALDYANGEELLSNPKQITLDNFDIVINRDGTKAQKGYLAVINTGIADDFLAVALGEQKISGDIVVERILVHSKGAPNENGFLITYFISAFLRPRVFSDRNEGVEQGDVLVARTESLKEIYKAFFEKWDGEGVEMNDPNNFRQCMDLITAWVDALGIPRSTVIGLEIAKNLYLKPHPITRDYFEIIEFKPGMDLRAGDVMVWDERVGSSSGHTAIATGEMKNGKFVTFSQNYPIVDPSEATAHLQEIGDEGLIGILRPKGFGPSEQPDRTKAPEKSDAKARIEAILAVEQDDSDLEIAKKTALSVWFRALTGKQEGEDVTLTSSILNLEDWEDNFQRFFNGESVKNYPLTVELNLAKYGEVVYEGKVEIDDLDLRVFDDSDTIREIDRKNGLEKRFLVAIDSAERKPESNWIENGIEMYVFLENGNWTHGIFWVDGYDDKIRYLRRYGGWKGIDLIPRIFLGE